LAAPLFDVRQMPRERSAQNFHELAKTVIMKPDENLRLQAMNFIAAVVIAAMLLNAGALAGEASEPDPERSAELLHLLRHDCGSCHGLTLAGGLGPSLRAKDLQGKPAQNIQHVILHGRPGTAMPGWAAFLSENEAAWLVEVLQKGVADDY
jgi:cytochrome c55X